MANEPIPEFPEHSVDENGNITSISLYIDEFEAYFDKKIVDEIEKTIEIGLQTAPYILISCAIDFLVTFWSANDSTRTTYEQFVNKYFDGIDGFQLYRELRCRLVHNHTVGDNTIICWDEPDLHKQVTSESIVVLNLPQFYIDFIAAKEKYFAHLRSDDTLLDNQIRRFNDIGVLSQIDGDDVRESL